MRANVYRKAIGFSLTELLIVMVIMLIVMGAVMGTLGIARKSSFADTQLTDANQNIRAAAKLMSDEILVLGERFMGVAPNDSVLVRLGFLNSIGFPDGGMKVPVPPGTAVYDELCTVQAANNTISNALTVGLDAYDKPVTNIRVYDGSGPASQKATLDHLGTDQLLIVQQDPIYLEFKDGFGVLNNTTDGVNEIGEAQYRARITFNGSDLLLDPIASMPRLTNLQTANPNEVGNLINPSVDALLANRLRANIDVVVVQSSSGGPRFLGLVTDVNTGTGRITLGFNDPIGVNPNWASANTATPGPQPQLGRNNDVVMVNRGKLIRYYVGSPITGSTNNPLNASVLYRRQGARIDPIAFGIENMQLSFLLHDDEDLNADGKGEFYPVPTMGGRGLGQGCWTNAPTPPATDTGRTLRWDRTAVRTITVKLYGRSEAKEPGLIRTDSTLTNPLDRGYYHVEQETTASLRNAAYNK